MLLLRVYSKMSKKQILPIYFNEAQLFWLWWFTSQLVSRKKKKKRKKGKIKAASCSKNRKWNPVWLYGCSTSILVSHKYRMLACELLILGLLFWANQVPQRGFTQDRNSCTLLLKIRATAEMIPWWKHNKNPYRHLILEYHLQLC